MCGGIVAGFCKFSRIFLIFRTFFIAQFMFPAKWFAVSGERSEFQDEMISWSRWKTGRLSKTSSSSSCSSSYFLSCNNLSKWTKWWLDYLVFLFLLLLFLLGNDIFSLFTCKTRFSWRIPLGRLVERTNERMSERATKKWNIYLICTKSNPITIKDFGANRSMNHISQFSCVFLTLFDRHICVYIFCTLPSPVLFLFSFCFLNWPRLWNIVSESEREREWRKTHTRTQTQTYPQHMALCVWDIIVIL